VNALIHCVRAVLKAVIAVYAVAILGFIWMTKDLTFASLARDPLFAAYSIAVVLYVLGRFLLGFFYRPVPDRGHRPTVSVVIPAFNEEEGIVGTIESCVNVDYPADRLEVIVVNDGSTDRTWERILEAKARWPQLYAVDLGRNYGKRGAMADRPAAPRGVGVPDVSRAPGHVRGRPCPHQPDPPPPARGLPVVLAGGDGGARQHAQVLPAAAAVEEVVAA
jgi:hypothetical protein